MAVRKIKDINKVPELKRDLRYLHTHRVQIGIFGNPRSREIIIGSANEFGANIKVTEKMRGYLGATGLHLKKSTKRIKIPARPFIRGYFDNNQKFIQQTIQFNIFDKLITKKGLYRGGDTQRMMMKVGEKLTGFTRQYLTNLKKPANHPYTLAKKKPKTNPLINTGRLRSSITYKIKGGGV